MSFSMCPVGGAIQPQSGVALGVPGWRGEDGEIGARPQECPVLEGSRLFHCPREKSWQVLPAWLFQSQLGAWTELKNQRRQRSPHLGRLCDSGSPCFSGSSLPPTAVRV